MTPHKDQGRGTFVIDRRFPRVGRIKRASGTTDKKVFKAYNAMLDTLWVQGRLDLLRGILAAHKPSHTPAETGEQQLP